MRGRQETVEKLKTFCCPTQAKTGQRQPYGGMRVLSTIFPDARKIAADITGPSDTFIEGGGEQLYKPGIPLIKSIQRRAEGPL